MNGMTDLEISLTENQLLFRALGDAERRQILLILGDGRKISVGELASSTDLSRPAVSHHLKILKQAGLLHERREGVRRYYTPTLTRAARTLHELSEVMRRS